MASHDGLVNIMSQLKLLAVTIPETIAPVSVQVIVPNPLLFSDLLTLNCAAMANVDLCEEEKELCWKINVGGVKNLVEACKRHSTHLTHISTDYIFDGKKESGIYNEDDDPSPQGYYAKSKLEGERVIVDSNKCF